MTKEQKELLLQDLCARLPYRVKIALTNSEAYHHENIAKIGDVTLDTLTGFDEKYFRIAHNNPLDWNWYVSEVNAEDIKPYLFPLSSMTEEQEAYLHFNTKFRTDRFGNLVVKIDEDDNYFYTDIFDYISLIDWLNKNHFDYRGLIEQDLAIDATGLGIYP